jgi:predicted RNA methylase
MVFRWSRAAPILGLCAKLSAMRRPIRSEEALARWQTLYEKQPYPVEMDSLRMVIGKGVFPPDESIASALVMQTLSEFEPQIALDMCCGSGLHALQMHRLGADVVYAVDRHRLAIECARDNAGRNGISDLRVVQSDLFDALPEQVKFDLIAFTPFGAPLDSDLFGPAHDGGARIIERFFDRVRDFIVPNAAIVMTHNAVDGVENDPAALARARGFDVEEATMVQDRRGGIKVVVIYPLVTE